VEQQIHVPINADVDIVDARQKGRALATTIGFSAGDSTLIATAISELARNIVIYARRGEVILKSIERHGRNGIVVVAKDNGPGIVNIEQALRDGFSTSGSLGLGLPGVRRLMDEFDIISEAGRGTAVTITKWKR
jgi:serine/threonine-protein kinase RsbT